MSASAPRPLQGALCDRECDWEALSRVHAQAGALNRLILNHLGAKTTLKQAQNKNAIETAILNRVLDRD